MHPFRQKQFYIEIGCDTNKPNNINLEQSLKRDYTQLNYFHPSQTTLYTKSHQKSTDPADDNSKKITNPIVKEP